MRWTPIADLDTITRFRESWVNLNPDHNRKVATPSAPRPLVPNPARAEIERLRQFLRFCQKRRWIESNSVDELKVRVVVEEKEPFTREEMERIYRAADVLMPTRRRRSRANAANLLAFVYVLRYAGLRIGDAAKLQPSQLMSRPTNPSRFALSIRQTKVKRTVYIPIPSGEYGHPDVAGALRALQLRGAGRYFFWSGRGSQRCATDKRRQRITDLLKQAGWPTNPSGGRRRDPGSKSSFGSRRWAKGLPVGCTRDEPRIPEYGRRPQTAPPQPLYRTGTGSFRG